MIKNINKYLLIFLFASISLQFIPGIESFFKIIVYLLFFLLLVNNIKNIYINICKNSRLFFIALLLAIYICFIKIIYNNIVYTDIYSIILTIIFIYLFSSIKIARKDYNRILDITGYISVISSILIIIKLKGTYSSAFLTFGEYFFDSKNAFSPILAISIIYFFYNEINEKFSVVNLFFIIIGSVNLLLLQSRTNILMTIIIIGIIFGRKILKSKYKYFNLYIILMILTPFIFINYEKIINTLKEIFKYDYFISQHSNYGVLDSLLSGRIETYVESLKFLNESLLFGISFRKIFIVGNSLTKTGVHNFWIRSLAYGGVIYSAIIIILVISIYKFLKCKIGYYEVIVVFAMIFNSMLEPFAPFGPGTTYMFFWFVISVNILETTKIRDFKKEVSKR